MRMKLLICVTTVALATASSFATDDVTDIKNVIAKQHDEAVKRLQDWIGQVSIAAEDRGYPEGAEYMAKLARDGDFKKPT